MKYTDEYYDGLKKIERDLEQTKAMFTEDNALVFAGPGSGKTSVLTLKAVSLIESIPRHKQVACITYGTEAANVMRKRINKYVIDTNNKIIVSTIHAFCLQFIIYPFSHLYLRELPKDFKLASNDEIERTFKWATTQVEGADRVKKSEMDAERKNNVGALSKINPRVYDVALKVAKQYETALRKKGLIDFEDIVNYSVKILREQEYLQKYLEAKYEWIFIDEYQDLGKPLHEIVLTLFVLTKIKLFIVGDVHQSIYGFTGANPEYMKELKSFIGRKAFNVIELKNNYRSSSKIVAVSGEILGDSKMYFAKQSYSESRFEFAVCENDWEEQISYIINKIIPECDKLGIKREEIGILFPYNYLINQCKTELAEKKIDAYISKHKFERSGIVLWLESLALWCSGDETTSALNLFLEFVLKYQENHHTINNAFFQQVITKSKKFEFLQDWIDCLIKNLNFFIPEHEKENFDNFIDEIKKDEYNEYTYFEFSKIGKPINQVVLLNWYLAKGLEFDVVVLTGMSEGIMPRFDAVHDPDKLKEEERKCFVGVTRAKQICYLLHSNYYSSKNGRWKREKSRYWDLIKEAVDKHSDV